MRARRHDPLRLDVAAFAAEAGRLEGCWPGADLTRLAASQAPPQDAGADPVTWRCRGERRPVAAAQPELWLHLHAATEVWLTCQRCLQPLHRPLAVERALRFVHSETEAEALDAESEEDVLALTRVLDLRELVEDELLLALPLVPRHEVCPQPLIAQRAQEQDAPTPAGAFAALRALKSRARDGRG